MDAKAGRTRLEGSHGAGLVIQSGVGNSAGLTVSGDDCSVKNLRLRGHDPSQNNNDSHATVLVTGNNCALVNLAVSDGKKGVVFNGADGGIMRDCLVSHSPERWDRSDSDPKATRSQYQGIKVRKSAHVHIDSCRVGGYCRGINITTGSERIQVIGCVIAECDDNGIYINAGERCSVVACTIRNCVQHGVEAHGSNHIIDGCVFDSDKLQVDAVTLQGLGHVTSGMSAENVVVSNCTARGPFNMGIRSAKDKSGGTVRNSAFLGCSVEFVDIEEVRGGDFRSTTDWTAGNSAQLSATNGELVVAYGGGQEPYANQILPWTAAGVTYVLSGIARGDGTSAPYIRDGRRVLWTGTSSKFPQVIEDRSHHAITFVASASTELRLCSAATAAGEVGFRNISVIAKRNTKQAFVLENASDGARVVGNSARGHIRGLQLTPEGDSTTRAIVTTTTFMVPPALECI